LYKPAGGCLTIEQDKKQEPLAEDVRGFLFLRRNSVVNQNGLTFICQLKMIDTIEAERLKDGDPAGSFKRSQNVTGSRKHRVTDSNRFSHNLRPAASPR
jgi:hypothetical protein